MSGEELLAYATTGKYLTRSQGQIKVTTSKRSPCQPPAEGSGHSAPVLLIDNSRFFATNIRLYRSEFFAFIGEPEEVLLDQRSWTWATFYTHGKAASYI